MPSNILRFQKVREMSWPSQSPRAPRGTMGQPPVSGPSYFDVNGNPITAIQCGGAFTFDVPGSGLSTVHLTIYKNGAQTFDGPFAIPMATYVTTCANDIGQYQVVAYNPDTGQVLGQTSMNITAGAVPGVPSGAPGSSISTWLASLTTTEKLAIVAGAFLLFTKKGKP